MMGSSPAAAVMCVEWVVRNTCRLVFSGESRFWMYLSSLYWSDGWRCASGSSMRSMGKRTAFWPRRGTDALNCKLAKSREMYSEVVVPETVVGCGDREGRPVDVETKSSNEVVFVDGVAQDGCPAVSRSCVLGELEECVQIDASRKV